MAAEVLGDFVEHGVGVFVNLVVAAEGFAQGYGFVEADAVGYVEPIDEFGGAEQEYALAGGVEFAPFSIEVAADGCLVALVVEFYEATKLFQVVYIEPFAVVAELVHSDEQALVVVVIVVVEQPLV